MCKIFGCLCLLFLVTGCFQAKGSDEEALNTNPVTNNPLYLPDHGQSGGFPMSSGKAPM